MKIFAVIAVVLIITAGIWYIVESFKSDEAEDFTVTDLDGNIFTLSDYRDDRVVLLDFMGVTCESCKKEMPELRKVHQKFGDDIVMLSIAVSTDKEDDLREFKEDYEATWRFAVDKDNVFEKYGVTSIVRVIIVDKEGKITYSHVGESSAGDLEDELKAADEGTAESVEISSGMGLATLAIGAGIFSFFAPCAFPMLPGYMSYYLAKTSQEDANAVSSDADTVNEGTDVVWDVDEEERKKKEQRDLIKKGILSGIATALGIITLYLIIGIMVAISGELVKDHIGTLEPVMGVILIVLGIMMVENVPIGQHFKNGWLYLKFYLTRGRNDPASGDGSDEGYEAKPGFMAKLKATFENFISRITRKEFSFDEAKDKGYFGLYVFGIGYGAASASCTFPLFIAVVLGALESGGMVEGFYIFLLYAVSMGVLMVLVTVFVSMSRNTLLNKMRSATEKIEMIGGVCLEIVGLYLIWYSLHG